MKKIYVLLLAIAGTFLETQSQAPYQFNFQSVARNMGGNPLTNQMVSFRLSLHQGTPDGPAVYIEQQQSLTNNFGLANLMVGSGTPDLGDLSLIDWEAGPYYLEIEMDATGNQDYLAMGTSPLLSVPYALHAKSSEEPGPAGPQGPGAYETWLLLGNAGTEEEFIASLTGPQGPAGPPGNVDGGNGYCRTCITQVSAEAEPDLTLSLCTDYCQDLEEDGYTDWRIPSMDEAVYYRTAMDLDIAWIDNYVWTISENQYFSGYWNIFYESAMYRAGDSAGVQRYCRCVR